MPQYTTCCLLLFVTSVFVIQLPAQENDRRRAADSQVDEWFREPPFSDFGSPQKERTNEFVRIAADSRAHEDIDASPEQRATLKDIYKSAMDRLRGPRLVKRIQAAPRVKVVPRPIKQIPIKKLPRKQIPKKIQQAQPKPALVRKPVKLAQPKRIPPEKVWADAKAKVLECLTDPQVERIEELMYQRLAHRAFLDAEYGKLLDISDSQTKDLQRHWQLHLERVKNGDQEGPGSYRQFWADAHGVLTKKQRRKFEALRGAPLHASATSVSTSAAQPTEATTWLLTLPAGFEYRALLVEAGDGKHRLEVKNKGLVLEGEYVMEDDQLRSIAPDDDRMQPLVWKRLNKNVFVLAKQPLPSPNGQTYINATLTRVVSE